MIKFATDFILGKMYASRKYTYIDLFAGTSALSEGFLRCGFVPVAHVEMNPDACYTIKTRLAYHYLKENGGYLNYTKYLKHEITRNELYKLLPKDLISSVINKEISDETIETIFSSIDCVLKRQRRKRVDFIVGGPPCQAFSTAGNRLGFDDSRGNVFLKYLDIVGEIKPTYVIIENVRGLLSAEYPYKDIEQPVKGGAMLIILDKLRSFGYSVSFNLYNAANFGAPQIRERVVIIAKLGESKVPYLKPTNSNVKMYGLAPWRTLSNAINNIPKGTKHHYIEFPEKRLKELESLEISFSLSYKSAIWLPLQPLMLKAASRASAAVNFPLTHFSPAFPCLLMDFYIFPQNFLRRFDFICQGMFC